MKVRVLLVFCVGALGSGVAWPQVPAAPEFRVNTFTQARQRASSIASDAGGNFVVVWESEHPGTFDVFGQRFIASGATVGAEFRVNNYVTGVQGGAEVALDASGNFVVVWHSEGQDGSSYGVFGRRFSEAGVPLGVEFRVNTQTSYTQAIPAIAVARGGNFVVAWNGNGQDGSDFGIFAQRFNALGVRVGSEFRVNTYTPFTQARPSVSLDANENFVVVWESSSQDGDGWGVFGQRYSAAGAPLGPEFRVNSYTPTHQLYGFVVADPVGSFKVVWSGGGGAGGNDGILLRRFDASGSPIGTESRVNTYPTCCQFVPRAAQDENGNFVVTWHSYQDGDQAGVFGQRFAASGAPVGSEFWVNTYATSTQSTAAVASDANGSFVVTWHSYRQDGSSFGIFGQRFGGLQPAALAVDTAANGVLEPGETVDVRPSWRNLNGAAQTFGGTLSGISGPAGATYAITDGSGNYGTVANAATQPCADCYAVSVSAPPSRPVVHWDASALETITPVTHGQQERWGLHIGDSFADVPRTSGFYRFVETLLHRGVTAGCTATQYCPASSTTREQMAVFVLVAREGTGYVPPACGTPVFNDVPASSPFCPWIEELARRGVVAGCGGGDYCPTAAVTREAMAVFVLRTLDGTLNPPACTTPMFNDVPPTSPFCRWIEELARRGVVSGCGGGNYCPSDAVTREQMGVFLSVTFGLALYGP